MVKQAKRKSNPKRSIPNKKKRARKSPSLSSSSKKKTPSNPDLPSSNVVKNAINTALRRQTRKNELLENAVELFPRTEGECEEEEDSASPIIDLFVNESGPGVFKAMTPLTRLEFERVWDFISVPFITEYRNGRGRQPTTKPKDAFFILLTVLKLPTTWANHGAMFAMGAQRVEKLVWKVLEIVTPILKEECVREVSIYIC